MKFNIGDTVRIRNDPTCIGVIKSILDDGYIILWRGGHEMDTDDTSAVTAGQDIDLVNSILAQGESESADSTALANDPLFW
jgi:hypothetical protein|tara:strand:+ start:3301 stop:3543 length:243 start_codon:yes stop_codon:yes gene_type:complete